jgi:hypothetical protein
MGTGFKVQVWMRDNKSRCIVWAWFEIPGNDIEPRNLISRVQVLFIAGLIGVWYYDAGWKIVGIAKCCMALWVWVVESNLNRCTSLYDGLPATR